MANEKILIVEDDEVLREVTLVQLEREGYAMSSAASAEQAISILERVPHQLILTDLNLPGMSGLALLKQVKMEYPESTVIVMTAFATVQTAVDAMKAGAYDYINKPIHPFELKSLVRRSLDHHRLIQEVQTLRTALDRKYGFDEIVGSSPALLETLDLAARMAASDATVLLAGETGTGKELVAKAIHLRSNRRDRPFVAINCGAVHRELLESELFGHVKGSFTGAFTHKKGKIEMADGGTLLLDEIGEMPLQLQVRLLRVIQEREIEKIGATSSTKVDVRIIAATHRDLLAMVKQGTFREDLYYRILVVPITLPPLRNRPGDVEILVDHFFLKFRTRYNRRDLTLQPGLMRLLVEYSWPGNVRELENAVERMVLLSRGNELTTADLPESIRPQPVVEPIAATSAREGGPPTLQELEQKLIVQALKECGGNQTRAARYLGISRRTLAYRLEKYGLHGDSLKALKQGSA